MAVPRYRKVVDWLEGHYPKPRVDQEWLRGCCDWISEEKGLDPEKNEEEFTHLVELQLLSSDLCDSMASSSGLSINVRQELKTTTGPQPILVEITAITEIGYSSFNLLNTRQARLEREDLAGLVQREQEQSRQDGPIGDPEDEGPVPNYPRQMLRLELSDGTIHLPAIEYRKLPELTLGETRLGCKLILSNVLVRNGIAFLEPSNTVVKGYSSDDRELSRDVDFERSLRSRLYVEASLECRRPFQGQPQKDSPLEPSNSNVAAETRSNQRTFSPPVPSRFFANSLKYDPGSSIQALHSILTPAGAPDTRRIEIVNKTSNESVPPPPSTLARIRSRTADDFYLSSDTIDDAVLDEVHRMEQAAADSRTIRPKRLRHGGIVPSTDIIEIEDDDCEFKPSKENSPVSRGTSGNRTMDVIDLSD